MTESLAMASDREEPCCRHTITTTTTKLKINFKFSQPDVGFNHYHQIQRAGPWVKGQLHVLGLTNSIVLTWVTTLTSQYTIILAQSGTFGSGPWVTTKECLEDPQYFLSSDLERADGQS